MKRMTKVAVILAALTIGQSAVFAAPVQGANMASGRAAGDGIYNRLLNVLAAIWGDNAAVWGGNGANHAAVWGGNGSNH